MSDSISQEAIVGLVSREFTIIRNASTLHFIGQWRLVDVDEDIIHYSDFNYMVNLQGMNYLVHPDDKLLFTEIIDTVNTSGHLHFRVRLITPDKQVKELDASGNIRKVGGNNLDLIESERNQAYLLALIDVIGSLHSVRKIQQATCRLLCEHLRASRVYVAEYNGNSRITINADYVCIEEISRIGSFRVEDLDPLTSLLHKGKTSVINDTFKVANIGVNYSSHGIRAQVAVPITEKNSLIAALVVTHNSPRQWTPDEVSVIEQTATRLWNAVNNAATIESLYSSIKSSGEETQQNFALLKQSEEIASFGSWNFEYATEDFKWSDGMYKLFEIENDTPVTPEVYLKYAFEDDKEIARKIVDRFRHNYKPFEETLRLRVNSKIKTIKVKATVLYENRKPSRLIGVDFDLSDLIESRGELQEQHERLIEAQRIGQLGTFEYEIDSNKVYWSDETHRIMGKPTNSNLDFEESLSLYLPEDVLRLRAYARQAIVSGEGFELEACFRRESDKEFRDAFIACKVIRDQSGQTKSLRGIVQDITERKHSAKEIVRMKEILASHREDKYEQLYDELNKLLVDKTNFFNNITHEFRTPLTLLLGPLDEVIRKSGSDIPARQLDQLLLAQRHALRLQKLVNTLLDFAVIESGELDLSFAPTDICTFTKHIASSFRATIEEAGLLFVVECEPLDEPVFLNRSMYEKIVLNLLSNAFKFTFKGKIEIKMRTSENHIELKVIDTGIGIAPANKKKVFERFNRVEGARSRTFEGTGIGLALTQEMVKLHGGNIFVKSELNEGSEFIVRIPKGKHHLPSDKVSEQSSGTMTSSVPGYLEDMRSWMPPVTGVITDNQDVQLKPIILVVDDNHDMRRYLAHILESRYKVVAVENGQKALDAIDLGLLPDLVLTDVMMPGLDGYKLLGALKQKSWSKEVPIILLTAQTTEDARVRGMNYGADDYLVKPFSSRELLARVDSRIQLARMRDEAKVLLESTNKEMERLVEQRTKELRIKNDLLRHRNEELRTLNEELAGLTFAAGHDLREPLRKMRFFVHRLLKEEEDNLSTTGKGYFNKVITFFETMSELVSDLSLYSYYSDTAPVQSSVNLDVILFTIKEFMEPLLGSQNSNLTVNVVPVMIGDPDQVKKVLLNLISNAFKFRKKNQPLNIIVTGKMIEGKYLEEQMVEKDRIYYELEVRDNGAGFEQQYEKQIFQLFRKLHVRSLSPGTGIGLTIVRKIVENHGGFVIAKSSLGLGASFKCYFPQS